VKVLLDANIYFALIEDPRFLPRHQSALARAAPRTWLSSVVLFELLQGARGDLGRARVRRAVRQLENVGRVIAPGEGDWIDAAIAQGRIWDDHPSLRSKELQNDLLIACTARRIGATVVTQNTRDYAVIRPYVSHVAVPVEALAAV